MSPLIYTHPQLLSWKELPIPLIDEGRRKVYYHRRLFPKGQRPFGLSEVVPFPGKAGSAAVTWTVGAIRRYYGCSKLPSVTGTAASTHGLFVFLLLAFVLALSTVLNMEHTAPADHEYLIETLEEGEEGKEEGEEEAAAAEEEEQEKHQQDTAAQALLKAQDSLAEAKKEGTAGGWDVVVNHFEKVCRTLQRAESLSLMEEEGLEGTVFVMLLRAEDEGAEAVPPFFKKMVPRQMTKAEEWTWKQIKGRYPGVFKPLAAPMDTAPSTPTSSVAGDDDRDRSESVLPREAASSSINVDGVVVAVAAPKPKKVGKMAAFRAGWKRIFTIRKRSSSFSRRATAASSVGGMA